MYALPTHTPDDACDPAVGQLRSLLSPAGGIDHTRSADGYGCQSFSLPTEIHGLTALIIPSASPAFKASLQESVTSVAAAVTCTNVRYQG
jgi:hypothetical protein